MYNYYTLPQFTAYVLAGNGYLNSSLLCTISVLHVNQPPVIQAASFQVNQATAYPLTLLGTIAVTDHDATDSFTFAEAWPMALSQYVTVDATTGNVFVANVGAYCYRVYVAVL